MDKNSKMLKKIVISKRKIFSVVASIALSIPFLLLLTGCPHIGSLYGVKVAGDGNGGASAVYEDKLGGNIYAQKISPDGKAMWGEKGILLGSNPDGNAYSFPFFQIIGGETGEAIIAWCSALSGRQRVCVYQVLKLDSEGNKLWQRDFERVDQLVSDSTGGIILDYSPDEASLVLNRVDSNGNYPWGKNGVSLPRSGNIRCIVSDGSAEQLLFGWNRIIQLTPARVMPGFPPNTY